MVQAMGLEQFEINSALALLVAPSSFVVAHWLELESAGVVDFALAAAASAFVEAAVHQVDLASEEDVDLA